MGSGNRILVKLLVLEQLLEVVELALERRVLAIGGGLCFVEGPDLSLEDFNFLALFHAASHSALPVLKSLASLFVVFRVVNVVEIA